MNNSPSQPAQKRFGFWASLPLSRKLLMAFGGLFVLALVIAVTTLIGLNRTTAAYEDALAQGLQVRGLSDRLTISLLSVRRNEKNFLLRWESEGYDTAYANYVPLVTQDVASMREDIKLLAAFGPEAPTASKGAITQAQYEADLATLTQNLDTYEQSFANLVDAISRVGFIDTGFEGEFRTAIRSIETKISGQAGLEQLEITLLQIRRNEKDYLARGDQRYIDAVHELVSQLKSQIAATDQIEPAVKTELRAQADIYLTAFDSYIELQQEVAIHNEELTAAARAVEPLVAEFETLGETLAADDINTAQTNSTQTLITSLITVLIVLAISILLAVTLSRQLTSPILSLTKTAQEISGGKFDIQAEVNSADEVGTLAGTFNTMTTRLGEAFTQVNRRAAELATVAEVGTATATILQTDRLLQEVVNLTKERFNLYHSHIYLLDEAGENLVLTSGAGEAGRIMTAEKRSIPLNREQSLVARAARERKGVTVNDVTQAKDFLPNPLLPDTRSELAVPMIVGGKVIGVFDVQSDQIGRFGESDINIQTTLAAQVSTSIQNVRSFERSKVQADFESLVNAIGQKIQRTTSIEDTLQTAIRELGIAIGASRVQAKIQSGNNSD